MFFKKVTLFLLLVNFGKQTMTGQSLTDFKYYDYPFENEVYIDAALSFSNAFNPAAPNPSFHNKTGWTGAIGVRKYTFEPFQWRVYYHNKLVGDVFTIFNESVKNDPNIIYRSIESGLTTGILGWFNFTCNTVTTDKHSLGLGFNLNDYFLSSTYSSDSTGNGWTSLEPQGYFFGVGPSVSYIYLPSKYIFLELNGSYSFPYFQAANLSYAIKEEDYPHPHFANLSIEIQSKFGFYFSTEYNFIINRGDIPNKTRRINYIIGFRFMM